MIFKSTYTIDSVGEESSRPVDLKDQLVSKVADATFKATDAALKASLYSTDLELSELALSYIDRIYGGVITPVSEPEESKTSSATGRLTDTRKQSHGKIQDVGEVSQKFKAITHAAKNWETMSDSQREALDLIVHKIARILVGDPDFKDHWDDIAGYASIANGQQTLIRRM